MSRNLKNFLVPLFVAVLSVFLPFVLIKAGVIDSYTAQILTMGGINAIMALSVNMVSGIVGQLTLGQCAFEAVGAYCGKRSRAQSGGQPYFFGDCRHSQGPAGLCQGQQCTGAGNPLQRRAEQGCLDR